MQGFPSTDWSQVMAARGALQGPARSALSALLERYLPALKWHLVRQYGLTADRADDLLQQFTLDKVIERRLLDQASRERGKFRTFLLSVLRNYLVDHLRREAKAPSLLAADLDSVAVHDLRDSFEKLWAEDMLAEAVGRTRDYLTTAGMVDHWRVFHAKVVAPSYDATAGSAVADLLTTTSFVTPRQVSNALASAKRVFRRELTRLLDYEGNAEFEVHDLLEILSRRATEGAKPRT